MAALAALMFFATAAVAADLSFDKWLEGLRGEALSMGIKASTLDLALMGIQPIPKVIELDRKQPEFTMTFDKYLERVAPPSRVIMAKQELGKNKALLDEVGRKYGVQPRFIVAFWAVESDFGRISGGYPMVTALATLAHDGRRSAYFRKELLNALVILDQGHIGVNDFVGSWAGATGQSQFMPSSFLAYAVDYNGDGRKDIWKSREDIFASIANFLARAGWKGDQNWGRKVKLPKGLDAKQANLNAKKTLEQWGKVGVRSADGSLLPTKRDILASLVLPENSSGGAAYLAYNNYFSTLKWNRSAFFALAVGTLADKIESK